MSAFTEVCVKVDGEAAEVVAEVLRPFAYQEGVVLEQLGDQSSPDPSAMQPGVTVKIFIAQEEDSPNTRRRIEEILYHLNRLYPVPPPTFKVLQEKDWANAWKEHYHPFRVGERFLIRPSWQTPESGDLDPEDVNPQDLVIVLDPGMAFGTGLHPTTQMCLQALEQIVEPGNTVLDVGTGSGILSIAAMKLGASRIVGVDTDELAVKSAAGNAKQNGAAEGISFWQGGLETVNERSWDVVVVNILAPVIQTLLAEEELLRYVAEQGWLVLSGIIDSQLEELEQTIESVGGAVSQKLTVRDWVTLLVQTGSAK